MKHLNSFDKFLRAEDENTKQTIRHFGKTLELYETSFNLLCACVHELTDGDPRKIPTPKKTILMIINRIIQLMQSIRVLTLKGYYEDVKVLERCLMESMGLCACLSLNEEEADNWINGKVNIARIRLVDHISLLLGTENHHGISAYGKLSGYVHTDVGAIASLIVGTEHKEYIASLLLKLTPIFDKEKVSEISVYPLLMLAVLKEIFRDELGEKRKEIVKFLSQHVSELDN